MRKKQLFIIVSLLFSLILMGCNSSEYPIKTNPEAKMYYDKAKADYNKGKYKASIRNLNKAIKIDSKNSKMYSKRGDCYRKIRKPHKAMKDYDLAIKYNQSNAKAFYHRGTLKIILGKKKAGCNDIKKAKSLAYMPANNYYKEHCQ